MAIEYRTEPEFWEYLDGKVYPKVSPKRTHFLVQGTLLAIVHRLGRELGIVGPECDYHLGAVDGTRTKFIPDIAFLSADRYRAIPSECREDLPVAPDLAIEVRSPSNRKGYVAKKIARYLACGTSLVLDVDPKSRAIVAHSRDGSRTYATGERFEHSAMPWLVFDVAEAFEDLDRYNA
ncbi:MAG: Uma2 family endonuclease [Candidatus Eremiobacteraeota bacterium]|nr:Uma2 family endonuclease [Candidatus Eremiobacteraeota bacterium]